MILIVGSAGAGKREYARSLGAQDSDMANGVLDERPVLYNLQDLVSRSPETAAELLEPLQKKEIVICNEVGCGVVPIDAVERACREATGRLCVLLARRATRVIRVVCGIPTIIKDEAPCE